MLKRYSALQSDLSMARRPACGFGLGGQRGLTTLLVTVILLFLATIISIVVARTTVTEQRISANELRHKQAFEAAQAGLDAAYAFIQTTPIGVDKNTDGQVDAGPDATLANGARYQVGFCAPGATGVCPATVGVPTCSSALALAQFSTPRVVSCGWSDDGLGLVTLHQDVGVITGVGQGPNNPLITKGPVNVSGSANVVNYFTNLTIWSGGPLANIGNAGKTFIRNPNVAPPEVGPIPPGEPSSCTTSLDYVCVTDKNTVGPDVIDSDPTLGNLTDEEMFRNFMGESSVETYKNLVANRVVPASQIGTIAGARGEIIVIEGDAVLPNAVMGTRERPVILVIDGNLSFQGTPTVYGVVYITGDVAGGGNVLVYGSVIVQGMVSGTGSVDIIFDPFVTGNVASGIGRTGWVTGSWRDW